MARSDDRPQTAPPKVLAAPQISLVGEIDKNSVERFLDQLREAEKSDGDVALEVTTLGGDAEMARRIMLEVDSARARLAGRRFLFFGKTVVYSAGTTIMSAFPSRDRWLASDGMLMIHCRKLEKTLELSGPIRSSIPEVEALLNQLHVGLDLEKQHFERLIQGSDVTMDELWEKALYNWYVAPQEALERGLVAGIWRPKEQTDEQA